MNINQLIRILSDMIAIFQLRGKFWAFTLKSLESIACSAKIERVSIVIEPNQWSTISGRKYSRYIKEVNPFWQEIQTQHLCWSTSYIPARKCQAWFPQSPGPSGLSRPSGAWCCPCGNASASQQSQSGTPSPTRFRCVSARKRACAPYMVGMQMIMLKGEWWFNIAIERRSTSLKNQFANDIPRVWLRARM